MPRRRTKQIEMTFGQWGGWRPGAGRKKRTGARRTVPHRQREVLAARYPVHVTLKLKREIRSLRKKNRLQVLKRAFVGGCVREGFRIIDWSIQDDHIHLIAEANSESFLARGIQGFKVRVARGLNGHLGRRGAVFAERYHSHMLKTPREVRQARAYVLNNIRHHDLQNGQIHPKGWLDPFSSSAWFDGWRDCSETRRKRARAGDERPVAPAKTWLLRVGWRRHGLIGSAEIPGSRRKKTA